MLTHQQAEDLEGRFRNALFWKLASGSFVNNDEFNVVLKKLLTNEGAYLTEFLKFYRNEDQSKTHAQSCKESCNRIVKCEEILSHVLYVHPRELTATVWNPFMREALKGHLK